MSTQRNPYWPGSNEHARWEAQAREIERAQRAREAETRRRSDAQSMRFTLDKLDKALAGEARVRDAASRAIADIARAVDASRTRRRLEPYGLTKAPDATNAMIQLRSHAPYEAEQDSAVRDAINRAVQRFEADTAKPHWTAQPTQSAEGG